MSTTRSFYGREWGIHGRATNATVYLYAFAKKADRDAWVRLADGVPRSDCGARDALTADEVRRSFNADARWQAPRWGDTTSYASDAAKDHLASIHSFWTRAHLQALSTPPTDAELGLGEEGFQVPMGCPLSAREWTALCAERVRWLIRLWTQLSRPADVEDQALSLPFCACGRRLTECDGSRAGCVDRMKTPRTQAAL